MSDLEQKLHDAVFMDSLGLGAGRKLITIHAVTHQFLHNK